MARIPWNKTNYNDDWIVEHLLDYPSYREMALAHNEIFGTSIGATAIGTYVKHVLKLERPRATGEFLTDEQKRFIEEYYPDHSVQETTAAFNERFGTNKKKHTMLNYARRHGLKVREDVVTKSKLDASHADGTKHPYMKVGDVYFDGKNWIMKTETGRKRAQVAVWEKYHGKVKRGYAVICLDGNQENWNIANLAEVPFSYLGLLQRNGFRSDSAEITRTGVAWCDLKVALEKSMQEGRNDKTGSVTRVDGSEY